MSLFSNPDPEFWAGKRVLLTGHTGFKGSWLSVWLSAMGAHVVGLSEGPLEGQSLYERMQPGGVAEELSVDIRDEDATRRAVLEANPEIALHLAAQSLVRLSYDAPTETLATNIMGTAHVLNSVRELENCQAVVCVTSDKCYANREWVWAYREDEPMGGHDPYSSSKGAAELIVASFRDSYFSGTGTQIGSARAGNVIGGGDWAQDRLIPDCIRAFENDEPVIVRNPAATRPWQHVLEPLSGYLLLAERMATKACEFDEGWNFGPQAEDVKPVESLVNEMRSLWGGSARWELAQGAQPHEAMALNVDAAKAKNRLHWAPRLCVEEALSWTVEWHKRNGAGEAAMDLCSEQIERYTNICKSF